MLYKEVVDLSWKYTNHMLVFPGGVPMKIRKNGDLGKGDPCEITTMDGFCIHFGTHLDCPSHMLAGGFRAEDKEIAFFVGRGRVLDCSHYRAGEVIGQEVLKGQSLEGIEFLLFYTGWSKKFGTKEQYGRFPVLELQFAKWLGRHPGLKGFGIESNNCDHIGDEMYPIHHALLDGNSKILYEALCNIDKLLGKEFIFIGAPISIDGAEGGPCRALALVL